MKAEFVREWAARTLSLDLDYEQAAAVAAAQGDVQVIARAGSGKTRVLVTRAIFLQQHCGVLPRSMLLLAFNKKAAEEMRHRLFEALGEDAPHVMTFHALAHAVVHPEQELIYDDPSTARFGISREVESVIGEYIKTRDNEERVRSLMLSHYRDDWERIENGRASLTLAELQKQRRALPRESLKGDYVKSFGEKLIANTLFEHGIDYAYERVHDWNGTNYRPDFTIPNGEGGVVIEYFGLAGEADYDGLTREKRDYWRARENWTLLDYVPADIARGPKEFVPHLLQQLRDQGISPRRLSENEIWNQIETRAVGTFTRSMTAFVGRCRSRDLGRAGIGSMIDRWEPVSQGEQQFLEIGRSVLEGYLGLLAEEGKEDFNGLVWRAISLIRDGQARFSRDRGREQGEITQLSHVMVDEFQDLSPMFFEFLLAIRGANSLAGFFCVGDDWQAINAFAGSDLRYFKDFSTHFRDPSVLEIPNNYRSAKQIVDAGNALMEGRGVGDLTGKAKRADTGRFMLCDVDGFVPSVAERDRYGRDQITPAVLRAVHRLLEDGQEVVLLSRTNINTPRWSRKEQDPSLADTTPLDRYLAYVRAQLPEEVRDKVTISTAHKYKGLEQSAVVILDAVVRSYPLIHPTWVFFRVFGDTIDELENEERRLFYVALTRAQNSVAVITDKERASPFIAEMRSRWSIMPTYLSTLEPAPSQDGTRLEIRVSNAYEVREQLKKLGYSFVGDGKYWRCTVAAEGFSFSDLVAQPWKNGRVEVEVISEQGKVIHRAGPR